MRNVGGGYRRIVQMQTYNVAYIIRYGRSPSFIPNSSFLIHNNKILNTHKTRSRRMKKSIAIILSLCILLGTAALTPPAAAAEPQLTLAVASDLHYNIPEETLTFYTSDPVFGHANRRAAMENESGFIIDSFLADAAAQGADYVLISGDMADNGRSVPEEHYAVRDKLLAFEARTGVPVFVINGNHDLGDNSAVGIAEFKEIYKDLGYDKALSVRADDCSYTADLGETHRLIALDSCDPTVSTADGMSAEKVAWAAKEAKAALADGRTPILMMHHNLLDHLPAQRILSRNFIVRAHLTTAEIFADAGIRLVLTGHEHCSDAAGYISALGNPIYDFATTSLTMYPLAYRLLTFSGDRLDYTARQIPEIDTAALAAAVEGYPAEVLTAMDADLTAFSKQFLKKGVEYRLSLSLTAKEDDFAAGLLNAVYGSLKTLLEMPLYGEGSAAARAAEYGMELPQTPYATGWDLATEFVAAHYAGEEAFDLTGPEVTALLRLADLILKTVPEGAAEEAFASLTQAFADNEALAEARALARKTFGGVGPGEVFAAALVSDLVYGFTNDDAVPDNNGALTLSAQPDRAANLAGKLTAFFRRLARMIKNYFGVLTNV